MSVQNQQPANIKNQDSTRTKILFSTIFALVIVALIITFSRISAHSKQTLNTQPASSITTQTNPATSIDNTTVKPEDLIISLGNPEAPITIVEFSDFLCPNCQQYALSVEKQLENTYINTGKVYLIYKFTRGWGEKSLLANEAAACAAEQGKFWPYYHLLMEQRASPNTDDLPLEKLQYFAQQIGLNMEQFNSSLLSGKYKAKITKDNAESVTLGVTGTPTFFINGMKKDGAKKLDDLQTIIEPILQSLEK